VFIILLFCSTYYGKLATKAATEAKTAVYKSKASTSTEVSTAVTTAVFKTQSSMSTETSTEATTKVFSTKASASTQVAAKQGDVNSRLAVLEARVLSHYSADGTNNLNHMYHTAMVFQDIFDAYNSNIFRKQGTPGGWDETSYASGLWNGKRILNIGTGVQSNGNGIVVNIPQGYDVLWIRALGDRWCVLRVSQFNQGSVANFQDWTEIYATGFRNLNKIGPDGAGTDSYWNVHEWMPIPIRGGASQYNVYSAQNSDSWISGIAFGQNIWNHATQSAVAYLWKLNPQTGDIGWSGQWNNDQLSQFNAGSVVEVSVPVINSGLDKMVYLINHNDSWLGTMHGKVTVNGQPVERFRTTYSNPFATHFNSKFFDRYLATHVPASLIQQGDKFIRLKVDMSNCNNHLYFRELGTHDYINNSQHYGVGN